MKEKEGIGVKKNTVTVLRLFAKVFILGIYKIGAKYVHFQGLLRIRSTAPIFGAGNNTGRKFYTKLTLFGHEFRCL